MPRFYFDTREGPRFIPDEEGLEFPTLDAAEREAAEAAAEMGQDRLPRGDARDITVEVRNEHGQRVLTVRVSMEIDRVAPPPTSPRQVRDASQADGSDGEAADTSFAGLIDAISKKDGSPPRT